MSPATRALRTAELLALFVAAPVLMRVAMFDYQVPLFYALLPTLLLVVAVVWLDRSFDARESLSRPMPPGTLQSILKLFAIGAPVLVALVAWGLPEQLFNLPRQRTSLWLKVMMLYPFTSVIAQEFVFRVVFFHRYRQLFPAPWMLIVASAVVFSFSHIVFRNWIALVLTLLGGLLFAWRYHETRSFRAVWLEHVLWGWLLFTCGLGVYFLSGFKNPAW